MLLSIVKPAGRNINSAEETEIEPGGMSTNGGKQDRSRLLQRSGLVQLEGPPKSLILRQGRH
jgi:hypothetical protein